MPGERRRQPYYLRLRSGGPFALAGICTGDPELGDEPGTVAVLTTAPNELVAVLHDRMPAILAPEDEARWLDRELTDPADLLPLVRPYPTAAMEAYPVAPLVSWHANDGPELIRPLGVRGGVPAVRQPPGDAAEPREDRSGALRRAVPYCRSVRLGVTAIT